MRPRCESGSSASSESSASSPWRKVSSRTRDMSSTPPGSDPFDQLLKQVARTPAEEHGGRSPVAPGELVGRFEIMRPIGRGSFGVIFRALDTELGRHVAVKLVRPERLGAPKLVELFRTEAEAAARLNHPNIVTIHDVGCTTARRTSYSSSSKGRRW